MIFGCINIENSEVFPDKLLIELGNVMRWENCVAKEINWNGFSGSVLVDKRLPVSYDELFTIDNQKEILVILDGFIYNRDEIVSKLPVNDIPVTVKTSDIILKAYLNWGESFVKELNGDFVICIYEYRSGRLFFYRDHLGIRPLAILKKGNGIYFSTDIVGLCKASSNGAKINPDFMLNMFMLEGWDYECLPDKNVRKVLPGHYISVSRQETKQIKYWNPSENKKDKKLRSQVITKELGIILKDAVKIRSDRRFIASAHISGGLDSGVVAALSRMEYETQKEFLGFTWSPEQLSVSEELKSDERILIRDICSKNHIIPLYSSLTVGDFFDHMSNWRNSLMIVYEKNTYLEAINRGINLIFTGWGGDEFISTGNRGIDADLIKELNWRAFIKKYKLNKPKRIIKALLFNVLLPSARRPYLKNKTDPEVFRFIKSKLINNLITRSRRVSYRSRRSVHSGSLEKYHLATRCEDWYINGQRNGIEYRYPLLDKRIIEYMFKVPSRSLSDGSNNRIIMRQLANGLLPENVISNRSKDDTVRSNYRKETVNKITDILVNELDRFRNNSDLDFVDFSLVEKSVQEYKKGNRNEDPGAILFCLKWAHEFTKGFYNS